MSFEIHKNKMRSVERTCNYVLVLIALCMLGNAIPACKKEQIYREGFIDRSPYSWPVRALLHEVVWTCSFAQLQIDRGSPLLCSLQVQQPVTINYSSIENQRFD